GHLLRSAPRQCRAIPRRRAGRPRQRASVRRQDHREARAAAVLPAVNPRASAAGRQLRSPRRRSRAGPVHRRGPWLDRPCPAAVRCGTCHVAPLVSEPGWAMHTGEEIGIDTFQADRAPDHRYRTTPLKGLWSHAKGGFYHDGRFATLLAVVQHYNTTFSLHLSDAEMNHLVEYLKSFSVARA